jgi:hypothetical protein
LDPELYSTLAVIVCTIRVCAVIVPLISAFDAVIDCLTKKSLAEDAVRAFVVLTALDAVNA